MPKWIGHQVQMGATLLHNATGMTTADRCGDSALGGFTHLLPARTEWTEVRWLHIIATCGTENEKMEEAVSSKGHELPSAKLADIKTLYIEGFPSSEANRGSVHCSAAGRL